MKSLRHLFTAVVVPVLLVVFLAGCSGNYKKPTKTLTSIAVTPATPAHLKVGATQAFTATGTYSDSSTADITSSVTWASGTTATATISNAGLATGVAAGTTAITATQGTVVSPGVTLTVIALTSIDVTPHAPATIAIAATQQFTATGTYSDASTSDISSQVTWSCLPASTATISAAGLATGAANGTAQVSASLQGITSNSVTLTVGTGGVPVAIGVKIEQTNPTIIVGGVEDFTAVALLSDGTTAPLGTAATWSSGTAATASILANAGIASGKASGTTTITATSGTLAPGTTTLTVVSAVPRFLYTVSFENGVTSAYAINSAAGTLAPLPGIQTASPTQIVFEPSGQFAYISSQSAGIVTTLTINPVTGVLTSTGSSATIPGAPVLAQTIVDPTGRFLYVLDTSSGTETVDEFSIDTTNSVTKGNLTSIGSISAGAGATGFVMDPQGRFVYVTNSGGTITGFSIAANGTLALLASIGAGPFTSLNGPQIPAIDASGQFLFVPNGGAGTVSAFSIAASGALTFKSTATIGNQPFQAVVDKTGTFVFVTNTGDGTVSIIPVAAGVFGTPATPQSTGLTANSFPAGLALDSTGTLLAVINNGENSVALFGVAAGVLTPKFVSQTTTIPEFPSFYSGTAAPVIGPSNVFAANNGSGNVSGFTAVATTGVLSGGAGSPTTGLTANSILAADSSGTLLFTSSPTNKHFSAFNVTPTTAALSTFSAAPFALTVGTDAPGVLALEPTSRFLYVADTTGNTVEPFVIANPPTTLGATASLTSVNSIVIDPQGTMIYALGTNIINPAEINVFDNSLIVTGDAVTPTGTWSSGAIDPSGHYLVALDTAGKALQSFQIAPVQAFTGAPDGDLTTIGAPVATTGVAAPSSVTFDPQGRFVFVSDATNGTITAFKFNETSGVVAATGKQTTINTGTGRVSIDASGTYLYAAVVGNGGSVPSAVAAFTINSDGSLTAVAGSPFATGASGTADVVVTSTVQ